MSDRIFRALLKLLPAESRGEYAREIEATFRAERAEASTRAALARLWAATVADVFRTAPAEHVDMLERDLRYAFRMLGRRPGLALTAVLTLALGIGTNTAIFSVVNGVLLAPLPYPASDRLVVVQEDEAERRAREHGLRLLRSTPLGGVYAARAVAMGGDVHDAGGPCEGGHRSDLARRRRRS